MLSEKVLAEIRGIVGKEGLLSSPTQLMVYEYDASMDQHLPEAVRAAGGHRAGRGGHQDLQSRTRSPSLPAARGPI